jgi:Ca2+-binding RTX toxin-like protein
MRRAALILTTTAVALLLVSGVALAVTRVGSSRDDTLLGTNGPDLLDGRAGDDHVFSLAGRDVLYGGKGSDRLVGGPKTRIGFLRSGGPKVMVGGPGDDTLLGGKGVDTLSEGPGDDFLGDGPFEESQRDVLAGGDGSDELSANNAPASRDIVSCGPGRDSAEVDRKDVVGKDCERVLRLVFF